MTSADKACFEKIAVPLDVQEEPNQVMDVVASIAGGVAAPVTLVHVIEEIPGMPRDEAREFYAELESKAQDHLDRAGAQLAAKGVLWDSRVLVGHRAETVARFAREENIDLLILRSHPLDPADPTSSAGTLSYQIGVLCHCSVMLVKT